MKNLYVNSRLHPLLLACGSRRFPARTWVFSLGEPWLLLTPPRLGSLAGRLGPDDWRVDRLLRLLRRHHPEPETFCRRLGVEESRYVPPSRHPPVACPRCGGVHEPHPCEDGEICGECRRAEQAGDREGGGVRRARDGDRVAREVLRERHPDCFDDGVLSPNYRMNMNRRLERDWDRAINRILMGLSYRAVAREFDCSVGLLHKKVHERFHWENN